MGHEISLLVIASVLILGSIGVLQTADAVITPIVTADLPSCDFMDFAIDSDELGNGALSTVIGPFPADEEIDSVDHIPLGPVCFPTDFPDPDFSINITNTVFPPDWFYDMYYVADPETFISNVDGLVNGEEAFRIDAPWSFGGCGINCPLIAESLTADGVFEPGETWTIVLQDYNNTGLLPPSALGTIGVPSPIDFSSSGSIVNFFFDDFTVSATSIPIDSTALLVTGASMTASWMIPVVLSALGIGIAVFTLRKK